MGFAEGGQVVARVFRTGLYGILRGGVWPALMTWLLMTQTQS